MDPNNNQQINNQQVQQPVGIPVQQPAPLPNEASAKVGAPVIEPVVPSPMYPAPKGGSKKRIILLLILLILALGMAFYVFFVKNQINLNQKASTENNTSNIIETPPLPPESTPATVDEVNVASPDDELKGIQNDVEAL